MLTDVIVSLLLGLIWYWVFVEGALLGAALVLRRRSFNERSTEWVALGAYCLGFAAGAAFVITAIELVESVQVNGLVATTALVLSMGAQKVRVKRRLTKG